MVVLNYPKTLINREKFKNKLAFEWYIKAAELDDVYGCFNVGECYYHGKGVGKAARV